jgi:tetratricopeptide (TPR) repeat protein
MAGKERPTVIVSSTARDLPEHRKEVLEACLRQGMFPEMMEQLPASDADAIQASLELVDRADIYVGVFAYRYGYVPRGYDTSVTEMEYNRAAERKIPRLIFVMDKEHPIRIEDVEMGEGAAKLKAFKERLQTEKIVNFFKSAVELRAQVINSLSQLPLREERRDVTAFHYVSDIPTPPEPYIAHPYTLLQSKGLIGRQAELNLLTDWLVKPAAEVYQARILNIVAIGGMGKSALTWKWFNDIAPQELKPNGREWGRMWWSFYESDATFENFVIRALAYVARRPREEVENVPAPEREAQLLAALDREPLLVVLDGLERLLIAYARMDAAHLSDDAVKTAERGLRKTADPRVGRSLQRLASIRSSRVLVSSRLFPAELETVTSGPIRGAFRRDLTGLDDNDALDLWRSLGVSGSRDTLLPIFRAFANHPLLVQALAGEISRFRKAPRDFDAWREENPGFDPSRLAGVREAMAHVLHFALEGLSDPVRKVLQTVAAFRMPTTYDTLAALFVGEGKLFTSETGLDAALTELEDRGLLGWDRRANRYDLHPIVRGVVWTGLDESARRSTYGSLETHFNSLPSVEEEKVNCFEDLTSAVELYNTLIGLGRYDDACDLFYDRLDGATLYRLSAGRQRAELLEMLFPHGLGQLPRLKRPSDQAYTLSALADGYVLSGQPGRAVLLHRMSNDIDERQGNGGGVTVALRNLSCTLTRVGSLRESEAVTRQALLIARELKDDFAEAVSLQWLGSALAARGAAEASEASLQRSLRMFVARNRTQSEGVVSAYLAQRALWLGAADAARALANRAWELAHDRRYEVDFIRAARLQAATALALGDLTSADERLHHALTRARAVNWVEEELPALTGLAELRRRQGDLEAARELLDDVWESAERGPYPLLHSDAFNVLAQIERDAGNRESAVDAATKACRLAWCDGPPYAYHWGLEVAKKHLRELGASPPTDLAPFDESKYEPMPEAEINPADEFGSDAN